MLNNKLQIDKANEVLRDLDSLFPDYDGVHQKFTWQWSPSLWVVSPCLNADGSFRYETRCICGTDVRVHSAECLGSIAKVKLVKEWLTTHDGPYASYDKMWLLCSWAEPPSPEEWRATMGTDEDYPANGRYVPVSRGVSCVVIPPRTNPEQYEEVSRVIARMIRENASTWRTQMEKQQAERRKLQIPVWSKGKKLAEPDQDTKFWDMKYRLKQASRLYNPDGTIGYSGKAEMPAAVSKN